MGLLTEGSRGTYKSVESMENGLVQEWFLEQHTQLAHKETAIFITIKKLGNQEVVP